MVAGVEGAIVEGFASTASTVEPNTAVQTLTGVIQPLIGTVSIMVGGLFGLYLIFVVMRFYYEYRSLRVLEDIRYDLDILNEYYDLPSSRRRKKEFMIKIFSPIFKLFSKKKSSKKKKIKK